jgi:hypothetical protein
MVAKWEGGKLGGGAWSSAPFLPVNVGHVETAQGYTTHPQNPGPGGGGGGGGCSPE